MPNHTFFKMKASLMFYPLYKAAFEPKQKMNCVDPVGPKSHLLRLKCLVLLCTVIQTGKI